jgi:hypothetical protein
MPRRTHQGNHNLPRLNGRGLAFSLFTAILLCVAFAILGPDASLANQASRGARAGSSGPVDVGTKGNEPLVVVAPDGTLFISALQHLYRSTDSGATWVNLPGPIYASTLNLNSDSSMSVDPAGRLYFTFDYPYAGSTAVCTSDDHGDSFFCNPAVVPGGTDRMWVLAPSTSVAYETTNEGLYQTAFLTSTDRGMTWIPTQTGSGQLEPQTGPLRASFQRWPKGTCVSAVA